MSAGVPGYVAVNIGADQNGGVNQPSMRGDGPVDRRKRAQKGVSENPITLTLDYIFEKKPVGRGFDTSNNGDEGEQKYEEQRFFSVVDKTFCVEEFMCDEPLPFIKLSDHFGVSVEIKLNEN